MPNLKDLRRRIRATKSMQQIFKAMEMVAAAKLRRAQARATAASPYAAKITEMLANLEASPAPLPLVSQYLPSAYAAIRRGEADAARPESMILAHISTILDDYHAAVSQDPVSAYA